MEKELKELFKKYKLGRICKIMKSNLKWAHGDIYFVTTWLVKNTSCTKRTGVSKAFETWTNTFIGEERKNDND